MKEATYSDQEISQHEPAHFKVFRVDWLIHEFSKSFQEITSFVLLFLKVLADSQHHQSRREFLLLFVQLHHELNSPVNEFFFPAMDKGVGFIDSVDRGRILRIELREEDLHSLQIFLFEIYERTLFL